MVITPAITHAINIAVSLSPVWAMGMIFLNTPEPIITPATNRIPVNKPKALTNGIDALSSANLFPLWWLSFIFIELQGYFSPEH